MCVYVFVKFQKQVEIQFDSTIKAFQSDFRGVYQALTPLFQTTRIQHQKACPYNHEQKGTSKRKIQHIVNFGLTIPVAYNINRLPSQTHGKPLYVSLFNSNPDYSLLRVFSCKCFPFIRPYNHQKFDFCSTPCIFLGYSDCHLGIFSLIKLHTKSILFGIVHLLRTHFILTKIQVFKL